MQISQILAHLIIQFRKIAFTAALPIISSQRPVLSRTWRGSQRGTRTSPTAMVACNLVLAPSLP